MLERLIDLSGLNLVDFFGINDKKIEKIKSYFPKIKVIARGNEIKIIGEENEVDNFEQRLNLLVQHFTKFNKLSDEDIDNLLSNSIEEIVRNKDENNDIIAYSTTGKPIIAKTVNQKLMVKEYNLNDLIFAVGPAGTGKTYIAIALAVRALKNREVKTIILSRPAVEAGENLGFLPGDMKDKLDPYLQALYDALYDMIPGKKLQAMMEDRTVQIAPLAYMRGRTLSNAIVILDEAQNSTINQLKMFLTRMGEGSKFIVTGDITQVDLPKNQQSGLIHAKETLKEINGIKFVHFNRNDVVRHPIVKEIIDAYEKNS
jgi:phosphate starvation-inducible PhoH-like protein